MSGRKETMLDLVKFVDKGVQVKLTGGRQVTGTLKGYDQLLNLVLDGAVGSVRDHDDPLKTTDQTRVLGLIVCRGTAVMLVSPTDGTEEIANPVMLVSPTDGTVVMHQPKQLRFQTAVISLY
uniref:Sm domain-containing protein n=1 Tax=Brassica oleracea var. oleracea TaxID=109376 RepID=A0A0D3DE29_BRAOL